MSATPVRKSTFLPWTKQRSSWPKHTPAKNGEPEPYPTGAGLSSTAGNRKNPLRSRARIFRARGIPLMMADRPHFQKKNAGTRDCRGKNRFVSHGHGRATGRFGIARRICRQLLLPDPESFQAGTAENKRRGSALHSGVRGTRIMCANPRRCAPAVVTHNKPLHSKQPRDTRQAGVNT